MELNFIISLSLRNILYCIALLKMNLLLKNRLIAFLLDFAILLIGSVLCVLVFNPGIWGYVFIVLLALCYNPLCESLLHGQSVGKRVGNIEVQSIVGKLQTKQILIRGLFQLPDLLMFPFIYMQLMQGEKQRMGDKFAGTCVVEKESKFIDGELVDYGDDVFPEAKKLSRNDVKLIRQVLLNARKKSDKETIIKLANRIRHILDIVEVEMNDEDFLEAVLKEQA